MTDFEKFAKALALTESDDDPKAWGDQGLAMGRFQMHPAFVDQWWPDDIGVDWSWDHLFRMALLRFYTTKFQPGVTLEKLVMEFHLGEHAVAEGRWDKVYEQHFKQHFAAL